MNGVLFAYLSDEQTKFWESILPFSSESLAFLSDIWILKYRLYEYNIIDRFCGLMGRVLGYRSGGPGLIKKKQ
jgi:hypothetical protein